MATTGSGELWSHEHVQLCASHGPGCRVWIELTSVGAGRLVPPLGMFSLILLDSGASSADWAEAQIAAPFIIALITHRTRSQLNGVIGRSCSTASTYRSTSSLY